MRTSIRRFIAATIGLSFLLVPAAASATLTPNFTQTINAGSLTANIYGSDDATSVPSPTVSFPALNYSFQCQTSSATLGDSNDKVNVTNLASGINTWNIAIAPTNGTTATWTNGTNTYKYNDPTGTVAGCTNGQMTVDPSVATLTDDCNGACTANDSTVSKGTSAAFVSGTTNSVTLLKDTAGTAWEGYLTGIALTQKVPALTPSGSYSLPMTITLAHT
ncbi:MAG TPA: hypothetical protein VFN56_05205 [Candidatus Saccharimonadales bacterium]|nr:hypothetical protein [Candidatus Saccharimonadales bacterium]